MKYFFWILNDPGHVHNENRGDVIISVSAITSYNFSILNLAIVSGLRTLLD